MLSFNLAFADPSKEESGIITSPSICLDVASAGIIILSFLFTITA
jgi:hypothetical protein